MLITEAYWHTYLHVIPAINFGMLILVAIFVAWVAKQTLLNRKKIMEMEIESRKKIEESLAKILNKIDRFHPEECDCGGCPPDNSMRE
jgi:hypothetical protein